MKKLFCLLIFGLLLQGCEKDETNEIPSKFGLRFLSDEELSDLISSQINSRHGSSVLDAKEFFLDTIKSSKTFYFIISNNGSSDITDVTIASDNDNFIVSPRSISLIPGATRNELLSQVISIDVVHGTRINGIGSSEFLNMGENFCNLTISGNTLPGRSVTTVSSKAKIIVYAELLSISLFQGRFEYDLNNPDRGLHGADPFPINEMNIFHYYTIDPPVTIRNTGNVSIEMTTASFDTGNPIVQTAMIQPGDTQNLLLPFRETDSSIGVKIRLDSEGTVFDINKLSIGREGAAYFALVYPSIFWRSNHPTPERNY